MVSEDIEHGLIYSQALSNTLLYNLIPWYYYTTLFMALSNVINLASALFNGIILAHYSWHYSTVLFYGIIRHCPHALLYNLIPRHYATTTLFYGIIQCQNFQSIIQQHYSSTLLLVLALLYALFYTALQYSIILRLYSIIQQ